jgi:hypothetical protein
LGVGLTTLPCKKKKKIVEKPPRNSTAFCGGGQVLSWAVEPRKEEEEEEVGLCFCSVGTGYGVRWLRILDWKRVKGNCRGLS